MISRKDVEHLMGLSRIALAEEEKDAMAHDLEAIVVYVSQIKQVTGGEENRLPMHRNVMREDGEPHITGVYTEKLLLAAPDRKENYVRVKKVLQAGR